MVKSKLIRMVVVLCMLILCMSVSCSVAEDTTCVHDWTLIEDYDPIFQMQEPVVRPYDEQKHIIMYDRPTEVCSLCGATRGQGHGAGYTQIHSYTVEEWQTINGGADVAFEFCCNVCGYERAETIALQEILDGLNDSCLLGGVCAAEYVGSMYPEGIRPTRGSRTDSITLSGVVEVPCTEDRSHYYLAERIYCPICGRPQMQVFSILDEARRDEWAKWTCYDLSTFLSMDMPENLPYQVIDSLRSQSTDP